MTKCDWCPNEAAYSVCGSDGKVLRLCEQCMLKYLQKLEVEKVRIDGCPRCER